ncbi:Ig-like domain-containing protein [Paenibacillus ferrarius]|uniref:Ig-like domain-containing protein n=1 Tax=Paenibacillus ferrarius TaxID=1469647 RepID=UPI003D289EEF
MLVQKTVLTRKNVCAFLLVVALLLLSLPAGGSLALAEDSEVFGENFNSLTLGQKPANWTGNPPAADASAPTPYTAKATVETLAGYDSQVLKFEKNGKSTGNLQLERAFTGAGTKSVLTYKVRAEQTNATVYLPSPKSGSTAVAKFAMNGGNLQYMKKGASTWTTIQPYASATWYSIKLVLDADNDTFTLYLNGEKLLTNEPMTDGGAVTSFYLGLYKDSIGTAYFDDFQVVHYVPVTSASFSQSSYAWEVGESEALPLTIVPTEATDPSVVWTSSNPGVATVTGTGVVTGISAGAATITAQPGDGLAAVTATVQVTASSSGTAVGDILSVSFDGETTGAKPADWKVPAASAAVDPAPTPYILSATVGELSGYAGKLLRLDKNGKSTASYNIEKTIIGATSKITMTYKVRAEQTDAVFYLPSLKSGVAGSTALKFALNGGQFAYMKQGGTAWTNIQPFVSGDWYDVKIMLDADSGLFDFYVDGVQKLSREPIEIGGAPTSFYLGVYKDSIGTAFFDEFNMFAYQPAVSASFPQASYDVAKDDSLFLPLTFNPAHATVQSATWTSDHPEIASVDEKGVVKGLQAGTATITAQPYEPISAAAVTVNVIEVPLTGIAVTGPSSVMPVGSRAYANAVVTPANTTEKILIWSTLDASVATVDRYGELTAVGAGTTKVIAANAAGTISGEAMVTVINRTVQQSLYVAPNGDDGNPGTLAAPFRTIGRAQAAVRGLNGSMTGDIRVILRGGTYTLSNKLSFNELDSGSNGYFVSYQSYPGEEVVVSGGQRITGWTMYDSAKGIYRAQVGTNFATRQLFVDGVRAVRARSAGGLTNATKIATGYTSDDTSLAGFSRVSDLEMVFQDLWSNSRVKVQSIGVTGGKANIVMQDPGWTAVSVRGLSSATVPVYYENAYELLDDAGEWYLNNGDGYLYYKPRAWEDLRTAEVTAPVLEQLMEIKGQSADLPVRNLQFQGIKFMYTTWMRPSTNLGHSDAQNNYLRYSGTPDELPDAAIEVELANTVNFIGNDFAKLGITGLIMQNGVQDSLVEGNRFYDISGGAVSVGQPISSDRQYYNPVDPRMIMKNDDILNNLIYDIGVDFKSASAISAGYPLDMDISNNEIYNIPYSGTHIGYGWDKNFDPVTDNVKIEDNMIYDLMGKGVRDGGAIYSLGTTGASPEHKNLVSGNYIRNQMDDSAVLYADQSSAYWRYENNVIDLSESPPWHGSKRWAMAWTNLIHDLDFVGNYTSDGYYVNAGVNNTFVGTTVVPDVQWPVGAQAIIANAGITPGFAALGDGIVSRWSTDRINLAVGGSGHVAVTAKNGKDQPLGTASSQLHYETLDPSVAVVDGTGMVTGMATGSTKVRISIVNGTVLRQLEADVYVGDSLTDIRLDDTTGNLLFAQAGTSQELHAYGNTAFGNRTELEHVTFTSLTPDIAEVSAEGLLTAHQAGSAILVMRGEFLGQQREGYYHVKVWADGSEELYPFRDELTNVDGWYIAPTAVNNVQKGQDSLTITTPNSGHAVYQGRQFMNELMDFQLKINATTSWYALLFGKQSPTLSYSHGDEDNYLVVISEAGIELQRYNKAQRTVIYGTIAGYTSLAGPAIPNTMLPFNTEHHVQLGTFKEAGGVRIKMLVDGVEIINYLDIAPEAIAKPGYFGIVSRNGSFTFRSSNEGEQPVVGLLMDGPSALQAGESGQVTVRAMNEAGEVFEPVTGVTWVSSHPEVAGVDAVTGSVYAVSAGTTQIIATYGGASRSLDVQVSTGSVLTWPASAWVSGDPLDSGRAQLQWGLPGGAPVGMTGFAVYQRTVTQSVYTQVHAAELSSYSVTGDVYGYTATGLLPGTTYVFRIAGLDGTGGITASGLSVAIPVPQENMTSPSSSENPPAGTSSLAAVPAPQPSADSIADGVRLVGGGLDAKDVILPGGTRGKQLTVAAAVLESAVEQLKDGHRVIAIPANASGGAAVSVELPMGPLAGDGARDAVLRVEGDGVAYTLPLQALDASGLAKSLGSRPEELTLRIMMLPDESGAAQQALTRAGVTAVSAVMDFAVAVVGGGRTAEVKQFGSYVERRLQVKAGVRADQATAVRMDENGRLSFVPMVLAFENGVEVAVLKRKGNSTYAVVQAQSGRDFADMAGHWAQQDVALMAAKLLVNGRDAHSFAPDAPVTRAEFATLLVRALGFDDAVGSPFGDVRASDWFAGAVGAAAQAGLVDGLGDGRFAPGDAITRQQMAMMLVRAAAAAGAAGAGSGAAAEPAFMDAAGIAAWAQSAVGEATALGLLSGEPSGRFAPQAPTTRAQAAVAVKRLLLQAGFMN